MRDKSIDFRKISSKRKITRAERFKKKLVSNFMSQDNLLKDAGYWD